MSGSRKAKRVDIFKSYLIMKTLSLKFLTLLLAIGVVFTSCDNDDDDDDVVVVELENIDIVIDQDQTFNMVNFAISFEQLFKSDNRWRWDYSHDIVSGKAVASHKNIKVHGAFGDKVYTYTHDYNMDGVVTSSSRIENAYYDDDDMVFTYVYDTEGMIIELTKERNGSIRDVVDLEYNTNKQLLKKTHRGDYNYNDGDEETFTYNTDGTVKSYNNDNWQSMYEYTYLDGNMVEEAYSSSGYSEVEIHEYDSSGRLINYYDEGDMYDNRAFEYFDTYYREIDYDEYNGGRIFDDITDYSAYDVDVKRWDFDYDSGVFEFCTTKEYFYIDNYDDRLVSKKEYFEGTPENLILVGYVIVDTRDPANEYKKTKESIYDANDNLLYYVTYEVSGNSIQSHQVYETDGTAINDTEMDQLLWMEELISHLNIN